MALTLPFSGVDQSVACIARHMWCRSSSVLGDSVSAGGGDERGRQHWPPTDGAPAEKGRPYSPRDGNARTVSRRARSGSDIHQHARGAAGQIAFNGRYLREALEVLGSPQVGLQLSGSQRPGVLRPVGDLESNHLHVIMPLAIPVR